MSTVALKICATPHQLQPTALKPRRMCGCFNCLTIFEATDVPPYPGYATSPLCPNCGQDTVLDGSTVPSLDNQLLCEINQYWFDSK